MFKPMKYKEICEFMGDEVKKGGSGRKLQLNQWQRYYDIDKIGMYYYIKKKYDDDEIKLTSTQIRDNVYKNQFKVNDKDKHKAGVYKIQLDNNIYIGQTKDFYKRFTTHNNKSSNTNGHSLVKDSGVFEIIELEDDKIERLIKETYWTNYYYELGFNVYNSIKALYKGEKYKKHNVKYIKINKDNYDKAIELLKKEGLL